MSQKKLLRFANVLIFIFVKKKGHTAKIAYITCTASIYIVFSMLVGAGCHTVDGKIVDTLS